MPGVPTGCTAGELALGDAACCFGDAFGDFLGDFFGDFLADFFGEILALTDGEAGDSGGSSSSTTGEQIDLPDIVRELWEALEIVRSIGDASLTLLSPSGVFICICPKHTSTVSG